MPDLCLLFLPWVVYQQTEDDLHSCILWKILLNQGAQLANDAGVEWYQLGIPLERFAAIVRLRMDGGIGPQSVLQMIRLAADETDEVQDLAREHGLLVVRDEGLVEEWVTQAIAAEPKAAEDVAAGKDAALGRLLGHVMKVSGGQADAREVSRMLKEKLRT